MVDSPQRVHLLGVGGVAMSGLAGLLQQAGVKITGSEGAPVYPPISRLLENLKIPVFIGYKPENLLNVNPDLVVVGNVIRADNPEVQILLERGIPYLSLPEALFHFFIRDKRSLVVAGTHGKTTTSALLGFVLDSIGEDPTFLIGGLLCNTNLNFRLGKGAYIVLEGDEYDSAFFDKRPKFIHYAPFGVILTSIEYDHADIYPNFESLKNAFLNFVSLIPDEGVLSFVEGDKAVKEITEKAHCRRISYGLGQTADVRLLTRKVSPEGQEIKVIFRGYIFDFFIPLIGIHNALNALGVWALLLTLGFEPEELRSHFEKFPGTKRRQEVVLREPVTIIDDFAHHPTAVKVTIKAVKEAFSPKRLIVCFEPRTNTSRRKIFQKAYAKALSLADIVFLKEPPNLEKVPIEERISLEELVCDLELKGIKAYVFKSSEEFFYKLRLTIRQKDAVLFMSSAPFDELPTKLRDAVLNGEIAYL